MQYNIVQPEATRPFVRLAQANMELLTKFACSPEVISEATRGIQAFWEQAQASSAHLAQSHALTALVQGLMKNYTEFMTEFSNSAYSIMSQGQAALMQQGHDAASNIIEVATARTGRNRQAA